MPAKSPASTPIGDDAVQAKTGKNWEAWFAILDAANAQTMTHREIVAVLDQHGVGPWWRQMVTVGYEQARGLREKHETPAGFKMSATKTINVPVDRLYRAWKDARSRARWLEAPELEQRLATPDKRIRFTWPADQSHVEAAFSAKGDNKSQVTVTHTKLRSAAAVKRQKAFWAQALDTLKEQLEGK